MEAGQSLLRRHWPLLQLRTPANVGASGFEVGVWAVPSESSGDMAQRQLWSTLWPAFKIAMWLRYLGARGGGVARLGKKSCPFLGCNAGLDISGNAKVATVSILDSRRRPCILAYPDPIHQTQVRGHNFSPRRTYKQVSTSVKFTIDSGICKNASPQRRLLSSTAT